MVRATLVPARTSTGAAVALRGSVAPSEPGVRVTLEQRRGRGWHRLATARLSRKGTFEFAFHARGPGKESVRVTVPATSHNAPGTSRTLVLRVMSDVRSALATMAVAGLQDITTLIPRAVDLVRRTDRPQFAHDVLYEADGATRGGKPVQTAAGVASWRFWFDGTTGSKFASASVTYGPLPRRFGRVVGYRSPFLEDVVIRRAPALTLAGAIRDLRRADYRKAFSAVVLRDPLGPKRVNPEYIFTLGNESVAVDTVTGRVFKTG